MRRDRMDGPRGGGRALALAALWTGLTAAAAGCRPDFAPYNRVTGLRVLAIQSEPAAPQLGETATFAALVVTPSTEPAVPITYHWSWCPFAGSASDGYACPVDEALLDAIPGAQGASVPPFDLGTAPTATFTNSIPAAAFDFICQGNLPGAPAGFKPDCSIGFPIQIMVTVATDADTVTAVQTVRLRFDPAMTANANPTIADLNAIIDGTPAPIVATAADGPLLTLPRTTETRLRVDMDVSEAESYQGNDDDGNRTTLTERLFLTWFVESGDTNDARTSYYAGSTDFAALLKNGWTPAAEKDYAPASARIYVVAHDNRGGVAWRAGTVDLGPAP